MTPYGKIAQYAIAAVSRLAEVYHADETTKLNSADIAQRRNLPRPMVAKVLTVLSQAGIVRGTPGPGGGYWLAREPGAVTLYDVVSLFERLDEAVSCPLGPHYCGTGPQCPMHADILKMRDQTVAFLKTNHFANFTIRRSDSA